MGSLWFVDFLICDSATSQMGVLLQRSKRFIPPIMNRVIGWVISVWVVLGIRLNSGIDAWVSAG